MSRLRLGLCFGSAVLLATCGVDQNDSEIARVGHHRIEVSSFQQYLSAITGEPWQAVDGRVATRLLDQFLDQEVIAAAVPKRLDIEIPTNPAARSATIRDLVEASCGPGPAVSEADVEREVKREMEKTTPDRVHVRQLLLDSEEGAQQACDRLRQGEDFVELSLEVSLAPNADRGGEIGILDKGSLPPELDDVIFGLAAGEVSDPVRGPSGVHVFQVLEVIPGGAPVRGEVTLKVRSDLEQAAARDHLRSCVERLAEEVGVAVNPDRLWFEYDGRYAGAENEKK
jgi:parvulin-like peptidyl-prolyl isomerase